MEHLILSLMRHAKFAFLFLVHFPQVKNFGVFESNFFLSAEQIRTPQNISKTSSYSTKNYCNLKLCSRFARDEEAGIRLSKENLTGTKIGTVHFSKQRMQEEAFENIFYSPGSVLKSQKLIVVSTSCSSRKS